MSKLLNQSLKKFIIYAGIVLACCIPVYYLAINKLWQYELSEHHIILTPEAGREDRVIIIGAVTLLSALFFVLLIGCLVLVGRKLSLRLWSPFYDSLGKIREFDLNNQHKISFGQTGIDEFDELNDSLNKLIAANLDVYLRQKEFSDNASHEMQTPLAIVQTKLELLSQNRDLNEEQFQLIDSAMSALSRASRINKNLLLLAKIENSQFADKQHINITELLPEIALQLSSIMDDKQLQYEMNISAPVVVEGNALLVEILLTNLLTNAIRYTAPGGIIHLDLRAGQLIVQNPGTEPLKSAQLFKRFAAASDTATGTGLGLAIVKQICLRYGWEIRYAFEDGFHQFTVLFK